MKLLAESMNTVSSQLDDANHDATLYYSRMEAKEREVEHRRFGRTRVRTRWSDAEKQFSVERAIAGADTQKLKDQIADLKAQLSRARSSSDDSGGILPPGSAAQPSPTVPPNTTIPPITPLGGSGLFGGSPYYSSRTQGVDPDDSQTWGLSSNRLIPITIQTRDDVTVGNLKSPIPEPMLIGNPTSRENALPIRCHSTCTAGPLHSVLTYIA